MSLGESNLVVSEEGMKILYRTTLNMLMAISDDGLTVDNTSGNAQKAANSTLDASTARGILGGSVVRVVADGTVGPADDAATGVQAGIAGLAINDAAGNPFESASAVGSGKVPYVQGSGTVVAVDRYETADTAGSAIDWSASAGEALYASGNGLLTIAAGLTGGAAAVGATIVGIVLKAPTAADPQLVVQLRV